MQVGYARVSTQKQSHELQLHALTQAGRERILEEKATGAKRDRLELMAALDYLRTGDTLVVWKLNHPARSLKQLIDTIEMLEAKGIGFRSITESIDTTTSGGRLVFQIFGALAEFERGVVRDRTSAGLNAARAWGKVGGRTPALSDEDLAVARSLLADPDITTREVAKHLGVSVSTLYKHIPSARSVVTHGEPAE
ncbi:MAG: recombinase family protein [Pseudomonadota bacterium]